MGCCGCYRTCNTPETTCPYSRLVSCAATPRDHPSYEELAVRIEFFGDKIEALYYLWHPLTGEVNRQVDSLRIFPCHYVAGPERMAHAVSAIEKNSPSDLRRA